MFGVFRSKPKSPKATADLSPSFASQLIDAAGAHQRPETRLVAQVSLWNQLNELEQEFGVKCLELGVLTDEVVDSFGSCQDSEVMLAAALALGLLADLDLDFANEPRFKDLPEAAKCRLLNLHVQAHADGQLRHHTEYEFANQVAFLEVEQRQLTELEAAKALENGFGICGWKSLREMNPDVIYEIAPPRKDA